MVITTHITIVCGDKLSGDIKTALQLQLLVNTLLQGGLSTFAPRKIDNKGNHVFPRFICFQQQGAFNLENLRLLLHC